MRILISFAFCGILLALLGSCGGAYIVGGERFNTSPEALQKQTENQTQILNKIAPTDDPVHGTALYLYPSDTEIHKNHIGYSSSLPSRAIGREHVDFIIAGVAKEYDFVGVAIRKRGIFDSISIERHNGNLTSYPIGNYEFVIFVDVDGFSIKSRNNPKPVLIPVDKSKAIGEARTISLLDSISQQAHALSNK